MENTDEISDENPKPNSMENATEIANKILEDPIAGLQMAGNNYIVTQYIHLNEKKKDIQRKINKFTMELAGIEAEMFELLTELYTPPPE